MTNEEKRFKIEKIRKYEDQLSLANSNAIKNTFLMGTFAIASAIGFNVFTSPFVTEALSGVETLAATGNMAFAIYYLKRMLEAISEKATLSIKIEDMKDELEFIEQEEKRGKTK